MQKRRLPRSASAAIIVEVIGSGGLIHHVGPFKSREQAKAWMAQNTHEETPHQAEAADVLASANFRNSKPVLAE